MKTWTPAAFIFALSTVFLFTASFAVPNPVRQVAVIYQPGTSLPEIVSSAGAAGARLVRLGAYDNIAVVDFGRQVATAGIELPGAWLIVDPLRLGGCWLDSRNVAQTPHENRQPINL
ncbi:MAG: hypothetical protein RIC16_10030 [Rhodospirillales bacterium]